jgi:predicted ATPase
MTSTEFSSTRGMRLSHVRLANWRNFVQADVPLQGRVFLVGPNASGKSNFLDAFRFLHDLVAVGGGFEEAIAKRGGVSKLRCLAARRYPDVEITVSVTRGTDGPEWDYRISFSQDNRQRPILKQEVVRLSGKTILRRPNDEDAEDPARLHQTYIEQVNVNRDFRELADFFRSI